jgi:hypothetical protein
LKARETTVPHYCLPDPSLPDSGVPDPSARTISSIAAMPATRAKHQPAVYDALVTPDGNETIKGVQIY